jgi:hypothetical protein
MACDAIWVNIRLRGNLHRLGVGHEPAAREFYHSNA